MARVHPWLLNVYGYMVQLVQVLGNLYINFPPSFPLVNKMKRHRFLKITHLPEEKKDK